MAIQRRLLPSMSALAAFDAAARTGSFSAAAQELNLTQGAISRQIRALEDQIGGALFIRERRRVRLTILGQAYASDIRDALYSIGYATLKAINNPQGKMINLAMLPTFGSRWLVPRLNSLLAREPDISLNFATRADPFDFVHHGMDAAIHFGKPVWPGCECTLIANEIQIPVASPDFAAQHKIQTPYDLMDLPLLHMVPRPNQWQDWFALSEIADIPLRGMNFEHFDSAIQAARNGLGAALLPSLLIEEELKTGDLHILFDIPFPQQDAYYLVVPEEKRSLPSIVTFKNWLTESDMLSDKA